ncbi:MAG: radical SAM protein [Deltaproteobacteria bacterium]|nr:radical SAM protein [Deltaproteobacteria bacterium]
MNVLFVTNFERKFSSLAGYVPLGIMSLSGTLRRNGHHVDFCGSDPGSAARAIRDGRPRIVAYSATTGDVSEYLALNGRLKERFEFFSVFGGPHPTHFPEMISSHGVDAICRGEGEEALAELADAMSRREDVSSIRNFWVKDGDRIHRNDVRPLSLNLDDLPCPDRELFFSRYPAVGRSPRKVFMASRGCPYRCTFCFNHKFNALYGNRDVLRRRSVDHVIGEIEEVVGRYPTQWVHFVDDTFNLDGEWLEEFTEKYPRKVKRPFFCNLRANLVTEDSVRRLKDAGCQVVAFGLESGSERVRNGLMKRDISRESIVKTADLLHQHGIRFLTFNIIGLPEEGPRDVRETVELNRRCRPTYAYVSIFQPYPTTDFTQEIFGKGDAEGGRRERDYSVFPDNLHSFSVLARGERRAIANTHRLFALLVAFPRLDAIADALVRLPLTPAYGVLRRLWAANTYRHLYRFRLSLTQIAAGARDAFLKNTV